MKCKIKDWVGGLIDKLFDKICVKTISEKEIWGEAEYYSRGLDSDAQEYAQIDFEAGVRFLAKQKGIRITKNKRR
jgi:hypothetical protein